MKIWNNIIIGAGLSGLILARRLIKSGAEVLIVEKSKSVGGRMATRRDEDATFDHGAQLTSESLTKYFGLEICQPWVQVNAEMKYAIKQGMNKAAKHLAQGLEIQLNEKVVNLKSDGHVIIELESETTLSARRVFMTCPVPQSVELLKKSKMSYPETLDQVKYAKALVGLFRIETESLMIKNLKYEENLDHGIFSISNQQSKNVSEGLAFTVVMNPKFSEAYFDKDEAGNLFLIENCLASFLTNHLKIKESDYKILRSQLKKWRYSHPLNNFGADYLALPNQNIYLIGDGFTGGSLARSVASAEAVPI